MMSACAVAHNRAAHARRRPDHLSRGVSSLSGRAGSGQGNPSLVRRRTCRVDDLHGLFSGGAARGLSLRARNRPQGFAGERPPAAPRARPSLSRRPPRSAHVGLPFLLLSSTSPLLSAWIARARAGSPVYRLYAASNVGSLLALVTYPPLVERFLPLGSQALVWTAAFALFALGTVFCLWRYRAAAEGAAIDPVVHP